MNWRDHALQLICQFYVCKDNKCTPYFWYRIQRYQVKSCIGQSSCAGHLNFCQLLSNIGLRQLYISNAIFCITFTSYIFYLRNQHDEPLHIRRTYVRHFLRGRPLDIIDESCFLEHETREMFVSLLNLFQDGVDELLQGEVNDYSVPLDVTFTGELAQDMGGPRKEFLT